MMRVRRTDGRVMTIPFGPDGPRVKTKTKQKLKGKTDLRLYTQGQKQTQNTC